MADWTNLPNTAVGVGGLPSGTTVTALRDNPVAIAEGAAGAPKIQYDAIDQGLAQQPAGGLGTYVFGRQSDFTNRNLGETLAGSSIRTSNANGDAGSSLPGTWRLMGRTGVTGNATLTSLWLRIS